MLKCSMPAFYRGGKVDKRELTVLPQCADFKTLGFGL